jgi:hypothetical protein
MAVRTTVEIPEPLHERLQRKADESGTPMPSLIVQALEQAYPEQRKGRYVTEPPVKTTGKLGPAFPTDKNPHDLVFS